MALSFVKVYFDFEERTKELNDVEKGRLLLAMLRYAKGEELPELKGGERYLFPVFRMDIDRDAIVYASKVENGAKGGKANRSESKRNEANESESPKNKNKNKNKEQEHDQEHIITADADARVHGFERFYAAYPRKVSKQAAMKAWRAAKINVELEEVIMADVRRRCETEWRGSEIQYIPHPATYLNQRRWEDETAPTARRDQPQRAETANNPALDYQQRQYSAEDDESFYTDLDALLGGIADV